MEYLCTGPQLQQTPSRTSMPPRLELRVEYLCAGPLLQPTREVANVTSRASGATLTPTVPLVPLQTSLRCSAVAFLWLGQDASVSRRLLLR